MGALIATGALLSWLINQNAGPIALASVVAFTASETTDALTYHGLRRFPWLQRANGSNALAAAVDSLVFPTIAFGGFLWPIVLGQFAAKTLGGALWAWSVSRRAVIATVALVLMVVTSSAAQRAGPPRIVVQAQAGTAHYPWNDYRPVANLGANAIVFLPKRFSLLMVASRDVQRGAPWVGIVALQFKVWSR